MWLEYLVVVDKSLATYDEKCDEAISGAIKEMQIMIESPAGRVELQKDFRWVKFFLQPFN